MKYFYAWLFCLGALFSTWAAGELFIPVTFAYFFNVLMLVLIFFNLLMGLIACITMEPDLINIFLEKHSKLFHVLDHIYKFVYAIFLLWYGWTITAILYVIALFVLHSIRGYLRKENE